MSKAIQLLQSIVAVSVVSLVCVSVLSLGTSPVPPNSFEIDKSKIKTVITDLKVSTMKINQIMDKLDNRVNETSRTLDDQISRLEASQKRNNTFDSTGMESDFNTWRLGYIKQVEREGYYISRSNKRVSHFATEHAKSMLYIEDITRQNNELFNLFSPVKTKSLIQQNDILNFKLSLQKQGK